MEADISHMVHNFDSLYSTITLLSRYQYYGLQGRHSNWDTWKKIGQSHPFVKTKDSQVFLQTDQKHS